MGTKMFTTYTSKILLTFLVAALLIETDSQTLKVIPEMLKITYWNPKYVANPHVNVRRYGRNSSYYVNAWGTSLHTWGDNVTLHVVLTEYLHNEYRRSFLEIHYKFCDLINNEAYIGGLIKEIMGISCPVPPGDHYFMNMSAPLLDFPDVFPVEKGGADVSLTITDTGEFIGKGYIHAKFQQKWKRRCSNKKC